MITPKKNPQNLHTPKNIHFSENPNRVEIQNFEPQKITRAYVCMKISEYHPRRQFAKLGHQVLLSLQSLTKSVLPLKRKSEIKSQQSPDPRARLSPVPIPVSCPIVSDDVQFKLQISNLRSLDIIHDALH